MPMKENTTHKCISCRVPNKVHEEFTLLLEKLEKNNSYFVANAITEYVRMVITGDIPPNPTKGLQKDRFAFELEEE